MTVYTPHDYQTAATRHILTHPQAAIFLDMGLGKTVITLTALTHLIATKQTQRALIIAPLRVANTTWPSEIAKWDHTQHLTYTLATGSPTQRLQALTADSQLVIINRENIPWLIDHYAQTGRHWPFDTVIIDELSSFKNHASKRVRALLRARPYITRIIGLTGTPSPNGMMDLFAQYRILDQGQRLGKHISHYRAKYFTAHRYGNMTFTRYELKPDAEQQIYEAISDMTISMRAADHLHLPALTTTSQPVYLTDKQTRLYNELKKNLIATIEGEIIDAANAAVLAGKLTQLASGALYLDNPSRPSREYLETHSAKLAALEDLIEAANGHPVLVAYWFQHDLDRISRRFHARTITTAKDIEEWNAGRIPLGLIHPASAGHGLNLQAGGHILIWFSLPWSLELYQQTNARLYRQGQTQPVTITHLVAAGTIDEQILAALKRKDLTQSALIDAVKTHL
ncbi:DEAD/DEAH box helicase [Trueperella sp. LYQ141]|uniref:DEAD/DEAH box helicase n=1 Tax=Trueperella sp. LYQ141 TaxID=3391058 RepID=UPI0039837FDC